MSTEWVPYSTDNYSHIPEPKTCDNCNDKTAYCFMVEAGLLGRCVDWQPIPEPVATTVTDAKETAWEQLGDDIDAILRGRDVLIPKFELEKLREAIAKRDEMIRKLLAFIDDTAAPEWLIPTYWETSRHILDEANELMGVK